MVAHPSEYPWSSYQHNALGKPIKLLKQHKIYSSLGKTQEEREANYKALFNDEIPDSTLKEIRDATKRARILGEEQFVKQITRQTGREIPLRMGGDRKSSKFQNRGNLTKSANLTT
ncbi:hypothetical protein [Aliikangiella coralliicola]|uniref:hypothetical protein n=1 Tax=Aliikangiella coralliicola TaxID=2592383 RepID=UPI001AEF570D|nr:hypothetical protein [Aliikangiella coralliicola]